MQVRYAASGQASNGYSIVFLAGFEAVGYKRITISNNISAAYCYMDAYDKNESAVYHGNNGGSYSGSITNLRHIGGYIYGIQGVSYQCAYTIRLEP